jgi:hypothetical protein
MSEVERAARFLLMKMEESSLEPGKSWYYHSWFELRRALEHPHGLPQFQGAAVDREWIGPMDGGVTYWAQQMIFEMSELAEDKNRNLSEYAELMQILEEAGYPCDVMKMSEEEFLEISLSVFCPVELEDEMRTLLVQREKPN